MIPAISFDTNHTLFGIITEGIPALLNSLKALTNHVALSTIAISVPLFYLHNNLFAFGFAFGFVRDEQIQEIVEKVNIVFNAHRTLLERSLLFGGGGLLAILTMPTSMIMATLYYSAQWGAVLYESSINRYGFSSSVEDEEELADIYEAIDNIYDAEVKAELEAKAEVEVEEDEEEEVDAEEGVEAEAGMEVEAKADDNNAENP